MIPKQLHDKNFRFCLVAQNSKKAIEKDWPNTQNYSYNDKKLETHIKNKGNYGVIGGYGGLTILDVDSKEWAEMLFPLLRTFTVQSCGGTYHFYFKIKYEQNHNFKEGEVKGNKTYVVGAGSYAEDKNKGHKGFYSVVKDLPILKINKEEFEKIFWDKLKHEDSIKTKNKNEEDTIQEIKQRYSLKQYLNELGININKNSNNNCPLCKCVGSFSFTEEVYKCFNSDCNAKGNLFHLYQEINNCDFLTALRKLCEKLDIKFIKKKGKEEEAKPIYKSLLFTKEEIIEQVYFEKKSKYCCFNRNTQEINYVSSFNIDGVEYMPIHHEEVIEEYIKLPSFAQDYGTTKELFNEIKEFVSKWLDIDETYLRFAIYNVLKSWVYERFHTLNYLRAMGEYGTGKSRFLDVFGYLHYKPIATSGALTSAVLFRIIDKWKGTLIIDEADLQKSDEAQDLIKIINQGYEQGRPVSRCNKEQGNKLQFFNTFCPKILATRREFYDKAVESRCMTYVMKQTNRKDIPLNLNKDFFEEVQNLRNKLLMWRFKNYDKIEVDAGEKVDLGNIEPRLKQVNQGFVSLFANDEEEIQSFKQYLKSYQDELIEARSTTNEGRIVNAIYELEQEGNEITATNIIEKAQIKDKNGDLWNPRKISSTMKELGFDKPISIRIDAKKTAKVYEFSQDFINNLYNKYCYRVSVVTVVTDTRVFNNNNNKKTTSEELGCIGNNGNNRNTVTNNLQLISKIKELQKEKNGAVSREELLKYCYDKDWLSKVLNPLIQTGDVLDYGGKYIIK